MKQTFLRTGTALAAVALLSLASCSNMTDSQQKMVSGGLAGTAAGAIGTVVTGGCVACGAAIGGVIGVGAGYLLDQLDKGTRDTAYNSSGSSSLPPGGY
ncbi:MAG: hypothetical protein SFW62_09435 [Alphaproteobacteria bacterium]|nr:hypothetical protein [Alphaproteobacteria bacterium]